LKFVDVVAIVVATAAGCWSWLVLLALCWHCNTLATNSNAKCSQETANGISNNLTIKHIMCIGMLQFSQGIPNAVQHPVACNIGHPTSLFIAGYGVSLSGCLSVFLLG